MATIDEDLSQLEKDVRQLKIEYEQYFGGGKRRPPADIEWRIETMVKRYGERGANMSFAQRFRYSNLTQTYSKYREIFRKRLKNKEEGNVQRHFGAAAREIERERSKSKRHRSAPEFPFAISCKNPEEEWKKVEQLYGALRVAREQAGEMEDNTSMDSFHQFVRKKTAALKKEKHAEEIEFVVTLENHRARLKARVKS